MVKCRSIAAKPQATPPFKLPVGANSAPQLIVSRPHAKS